MRFQTMLRGLPLLLLASCAYSASLTINFASSLLSAAPGRTITFTATVTNTTAATIFLNSDSLNIAAPLTTDDSKFFGNFPLSLAAGQFVTAPIFDVLVPSTAPLALYTGRFDIFGGSSATGSTDIGTATFAVNTAPEPGTFGFALISLAACASFILYKRRVH